MSNICRKNITMRSNGLPKASRFLHMQKYAPPWEAAELSVIFNQLDATDNPSGLHNVVRFHCKT